VSLDRDMTYILTICSTHVSIVHRFRDIITLAHFTANDLERSFNPVTTVNIVHVRFSILTYVCYNFRDIGVGKVVIAEDILTVAHWVIGIALSIDHI